MKRLFTVTGLLVVACRLFAAAPLTGRVVDFGTKQAIDFANQRHIILIDGMRLAKLMIEHNFGVTTKQVFEIKALDTDLFN